MSFMYYPKNFRANGWGWHRGGSAAKAVRGFLKHEQGKGSTDEEPLVGNGSLYPKLPTEDDTIFSTGGRLYPALPADEYETGAVEEVVEEACAAVNVNAVSQASEGGSLEAAYRLERISRQLKGLQDHSQAISS